MRMEWQRLTHCSSAGELASDYRALSWKIPRTTVAFWLPCGKSHGRHGSPVSWKGSSGNPSGPNFLLSWDGGPDSSLNLVKGFHNGKTNWKQR